jgi:hypothetical protein
MYFPKRDELLLRFVFALPKASRIGLVWSSLSLTDSTLSMCPEAAAINWRTFFDASVLPEPDSPGFCYRFRVVKNAAQRRSSPEINIHWLRFSSINNRKALSDNANLTEGKYERIQELLAHYMQH